MAQIISRRNPIVARFRDVARRVDPADDSALLEGPRLISEALAGGVPIEVAAFNSASAAQRWTTLVDRLRDVTTVIQVSSPVMAAISPMSTPSGLVAIARMPPQTLDSALCAVHPLVLGLLGVQDPGNTGAVIRAAEAGGATGVVTVGGADPRGWKALRGSMGSALRLPLSRADDPTAVAADARSYGLRLLAAAPRGGTPAPQADLSHPSLIWLGAEGAGLEGVIAEADEIISVPMHPPVESLNVAVAAALLVYEAGRQRNHSSSTASEARSA